MNVLSQAIYTYSISLACLEQNEAFCLQPFVGNRYILALYSHISWSEQTNIEILSCWILQIFYAVDTKNILQFEFFFTGCEWDFVYWRSSFVATPPWKNGTAPFSATTGTRQVGQSIPRTGKGEHQGFKVIHDQNIEIVIINHINLKKSSIWVL